MKKPGTIRVVIGEPIAPAGKNPRELSDEVKQSIEAGLARIAESAAHTPSMASRLDRAAR